MREREIFDAALAIADLAERSAYLAEVCAGDRGLREHIEELLDMHQQLGSFLEPPAPCPIATVDEPLTEQPGTVIGPYKLLQQIGEGGMGVVYMAEQQQPLRRKVALKIIKPGLDSKQVIARFEAERQALALMDHQNIAKVFDAGATDSGRPYFVMELVHGIPITQYCDDHHLTPKARLELFLPVCHAIQHAHQKGIIHRDLKPSNVLVCLYDGVAVPKVIDFGVAKATGQPLTERTMFTQFGSLVGTLEYMSPEQAEMSQLGIDTRSDVYSLGVLLYELLTGSTPLERHRLCEAGLDEIRRLIREEEPVRPSTRLSTSGVALAAISAQRQTEPAKLTRLVRGELDWIVMKALEKDRNRRYETANGLARDVERYLHDEPVEACPPSAGYKLSKFAHKHKAGLATAAAFVGMLLVGTIISTWQAVRATSAENEAAEQRDIARVNEDEARKSEQAAQQQRDEAQRQRDEVRALNERLQRTLYASHMNLAQHAWEAGSIGRVDELLEQHRPKPGETDLRGFEWYYLYRLCHPELLTLKGFVLDSPADRRVAFSPDGKRLAVASNDQTVKVWDAQTGQQLLTLNFRANSVAFSPDGKRLATGGPTWDDTKKDHAGEVKVWDAQTGQELLSHKVPSGYYHNVVFSPDGKRLAIGSGGDSARGGAFPGIVKLLDAQTGQELLSLKGLTDGVSRSVAFSPDGKRLASVGAEVVKVWDAQTGQELLSLKHTRTGPFGGVYSVAFSPDGQRLVSSGAQGVKVWDAQTGQELLSFPGGRSVVFSPDGKRLADNSIRVWDAQTGQQLISFKGGAPDGVVVFSPDGTRLASGGADQTVKILDVTTNPEARSFSGHTGSVHSVTFSPDGKHLAGISLDPTTNERAVKVWEARTGQELLSLKGHAGRVLRVVFSPDGKRLASASGTWDDTKNDWVAGEVKVWDAQTGRELLTLKGHTAAVVSMAFSPDGTRLASSSSWPTGTGIRNQPQPGGVKVWNAQTGQELLTLKGHRGFVDSVAFSPDGKRLATLSRDNTVKVWDAQTGQETLTLKVRHLSISGSVAFSPDGKRLASSSNGGVGPIVGSPGEVKVWDAQTGEELLTLKGHIGPQITSVVFSPDGKRLASGTGEIRLTRVVFSPDGKRLAGAVGGLVGPGPGRGPGPGITGDLKVWDAQTGQELLTLFKGGGFHDGLAFSPDGHWLATDVNGRVTIWDATPRPEKP
jgi:WD40 repeat protein/serine/threonine protein kinase